MPGEATYAVDGTGSPVAHSPDLGPHVKTTICVDRPWTWPMTVPDLPSDKPGWHGGPEWDGRALPSCR